MNIPRVYFKVESFELADGLDTLVESKEELKITRLEIKSSRRWG